MSKNVSRGVGNFNKTPLELIGSTGFRVRIDPLYTPENLDDDLWVEYTLAAGTNRLTCHYAAAGGSPPSSIPIDEILSDNHIMQNVFSGAMPSYPIIFYGMYINLTNNSTVAEVGLIARDNPGQNESLDNPQVQMKMCLYSHESAVN